MNIYIYIYNFPTNIIPAKIARLELSGKSPMDVRIPPLRIKNHRCFQNKHPLTKKRKYPGRNKKPNRIEPANPNRTEANRLIPEREENLVALLKQNLDPSFFRSGVGVVRGVLIEVHSIRRPTSLVENTINKQVHKRSINKQEAHVKQTE